MSTVDPAARIAAWQKQAGRHGLPWQNTRDSYRIWLSEIMLQQTQASTVVPYFQRFLQRFPDIRHLADAPLDDVLQAWAGLGYYARARNLHRCAQQVRDHYNGKLPTLPEQLAELPGIGRSTAAAIAAFSTGARVPILDGNVRRVLIRYLALEGDPQSSPTTRTLWSHAESWLDQAPADLDMVAYTQGLMDLGATVCTRGRPDCARCPLVADCAAHRQGLQNSLPAPRTRRTQPRHHSTLLIIESGQRLWLQRRPETGIWGGLWTPPMLGANTIPDHIRETLDPAGTHTRMLAAIEHVFTHFRLMIQPVWLRLPEAPADVLKKPEPWPKPRMHGPRNPAIIAWEAGQSAWIPAQSLADIAMPAPVSALLHSLYRR